MTFSERIGVKPVRSLIQLDDMDAALRNGLWTAFFEIYLQHVRSPITSGTQHSAFYRELWISFFKMPVDSLPQSHNQFTTAVREWFFGAKWNEVYDFIAFTARNGKEAWNHSQFLNHCNYFLAREMSGFRIVNLVVTPITTDHELSAIEGAIAGTAGASLHGAHGHLKQALALLSDRNSPDYRNSIKESISAVESIAQTITGDSTAELGKALKVLEAKIDLHGALKSAFASMYGYTSDESGIRHAMTDIPSLDVDDAIYMLIACSAFVNYLMSKCRKVGIPFA